MRLVVKDSKRDRTILCYVFVLTYPHIFRDPNPDNSKMRIKFRPHSNLIVYSVIFTFDPTFAQILDPSVKSKLLYLPIRY